MTGLISNTNYGNITTAITIGATGTTPPVWDDIQTYTNATATDQIVWWRFESEFKVTTGSDMGMTRSIARMKFRVVDSLANILENKEHGEDLQTGPHIYAYACAQGDIAHVFLNSECPAGETITLQIGFGITVTIGDYLTTCNTYVRNLTSEVFLK